MKRFLQLCSGAAALLAMSEGAHAADHRDSPAATAEPTADITDVYAWMSADAQMLNLIVNVGPFAASGAGFSDAVTYAIHVNSSAQLGGAQTETLIRCRYYDADNLECWLGSEYVVGDPSNTAGLTSASGDVRVFAGLRDDPFFFELVGFNETAALVVAAAGGLAFDPDGCPTLDAPTSAALVGQLQHGTAGAAASDTFAGARVMSLVLQVDKALVTGGGPILGVWASTHN